MTLRGTPLGKSRILERITSEVSERDAVLAMGEAIVHTTFESNKSNRSTDWRRNKSVLADQ